jgi:hypothetical protein
MGSGCFRGRRCLCRACDNFFEVEPQALANRVEPIVDDPPDVGTRRLLCRFGEALRAEANLVRFELLTNASSLKNIIGSKYSTCLAPGGCRLCTGLCTGYRDTGPLMQERISNVTLQSIEYRFT